MAHWRTLRSLHVPTFDFYSIVGVIPSIATIRSTWTHWIHTQCGVHECHTSAIWMCMCVITGFISPRISMNCTQRTNACLCEQCRRGFFCIIFVQTKINYLFFWFRRTIKLIKFFASFAYNCHQTSFRSMATSQWDSIGRKDCTSVRYTHKYVVNAFFTHIPHKFCDSTKKKVKFSPKGIGVFSTKNNNQIHNTKKQRPAFMAHSVRHKFMRVPKINTYCLCQEIALNAIDYALTCKWIYILSPSVRCHIEW